MNNILREEFEGLFRLQEEVTSGIKNKAFQLKLLEFPKTLGITKFSVAYKRRSKEQKILQVDLTGTVNFGLDLSYEGRVDFYSNLLEASKVNFVEYPLIFAFKKYLPYKDTETHSISELVTELVTVSSSNSNSTLWKGKNFNEYLLSNFKAYLEKDSSKDSLELSKTIENLEKDLKKGTGINLNSESFFRSTNEKWLQTLDENISEEVKKDISNVINKTFPILKKFKVFKYDKKTWFGEIDKSLTGDWLTSKGQKFLEKKDWTGDLTILKNNFLADLKSIKFNKFDGGSSGWKISWPEGKNSKFPYLKDFITSVQNNSSQEEGLQNLLILNTLSEGKNKDVYYIELTDENFKDYDLAFLVKDKKNSEFQTYCISSKSSSSNNAFRFINTVKVLKGELKSSLPAAGQFEKKEFNFKNKAIKTFFKKVKSNEDILEKVLEGLGSGVAFKTILDDREKSGLPEEVVEKIYTDLAPFFFQKVWGWKEGYKPKSINEGVVNTIRKFFKVDPFEGKIQKNRAALYENILVKSLIWNGLDKYLAQYSQPLVPKEGFGVLLKHTGTDKYQAVPFKDPTIGVPDTGCLLGGGAHNGQPVKLDRTAPRSELLNSLTFTKDEKGKVQDSKKKLSILNDLVVKKVKELSDQVEKLTQEVKDSPKKKRKTSKATTKNKPEASNSKTIDYNSPEVIQVQKDHKSKKNARRKT